MLFSNGVRWPTTTAPLKSNPPGQCTTRQSPPSDFQGLRGAYPRFYARRPESDDRFPVLRYARGSIAPTVSCSPYVYAASVPHRDLLLLLLLLLLPVAAADRRLGQRRYTFARRPNICRLPAGARRHRRTRARESERRTPSCWYFRTTAAAAASRPRAVKWAPSRPRMSKVSRLSRLSYAFPVFGLSPRGFFSTVFPASRLCCAWAFSFRVSSRPSDDPEWHDSRRPFVHRSLYRCTLEESVRFPPISRLLFHETSATLVYENVDLHVHVTKYRDFS